MQAAHFIALLAVPNANALPRAQAILDFRKVCRGIFANFRRRGHGSFGIDRRQAQERLHSARARARFRDVAHAERQREGNHVRRAAAQGNGAFPGGLFARLRFPPRRLDFRFRRLLAVLAQQNHANGPGAVRALAIALRQLQAARGAIAENHFHHALRLRHFRHARADFGHDFRVRAHGREGADHTG